MSSTATTCLPAPMAYSISVPVAESETMRVGRLAMTTSPLAAFTVAGNPAVLLPPAPAFLSLPLEPHAAAVTATSTATAASSRGACVLRMDT